MHLARTMQRQAHHEEEEYGTLKGDDPPLAAVFRGLVANVSINKLLYMVSEELMLYGLSVKSDKAYPI